MRDLQEYKNPVAFFASGLGDHIVNLPALRALCSLFPNSLRLLCMSNNPEVFFGDLAVRSFLEIDCEADWHKKVFSPKRAAELIGDCDLFVSMNLWYSSDVEDLLKLLDPEMTIGFHDAFKRAVARDNEKHMADVAFDIPLAFDSSLNIDDFSQPFHIHDKYIDIANDILKWVPDGKRVLTLHADTYWDKRWATENWTSTLDQFLAKHPEYIVLVVGQRDFEIDTGKLGDKVVPCYGISLGASLALVSKSHRFIGIDSCMLHAADIFRVPSVGLFGATSPTQWGLRFGPHEHVYGDGSMQNLSVEDVLTALEEIS